MRVWEENLASSWHDHQNVSVTEGAQCGHVIGGSWEEAVVQPVVSTQAGLNIIFVDYFVTNAYTHKQNILHRGMTLLAVMSLLITETSIHISNSPAKFFLFFSKC